MFDYKIPIIIAGAVMALFLIIALIRDKIHSTKQASDFQADQDKKPQLDAVDISAIEEQLKNLCKNAVRLSIDGNNEYQKGGTRFGGNPDVPKDFKWPYFETDTPFDKIIKPRPLAFLAQFNLSEVSEFDTEGLLPKSGTLAFFYEVASMRWGYEKEDEGCARVYWFRNPEDLSPAEFPEDLAAEYRFPALNIALKSEKTYPDSEDYYLDRDDYSDTIDAFKRAQSSVDDSDNWSKLLGWADIVQGNITSDCERIARGYTSDEVWNSDDFSKAELEEIEKHASEWTLLFQLDSFYSGDFGLSFVDAGRIYFYIREEDLRLRRFDKAWLILQTT